MARQSIYYLLITVFFMMTLGVVMLASTSGYSAEAQGDVYFDVKRQVMWLVIAGGVGLVVSLIDYRIWKRWAVWIYVASAVGLILCFVPGIGVTHGGASRWISAKLIGISGIHVQPSEWAKIACIIALGTWIARTKTDMRSFREGLVIPLGIIGGLAMLIAMEVDLGSATLMAAVGIAIMFIAGTPMKYLSALSVLGVVALILGVYLVPERIDRWMAFLDLEAHARGDGMQQWISTHAFGLGGVEGLGLGNSRWKMYYLPFAHTDFIFAIIGEELGLRVTLLVVFGYILFLIFGVFIAMNAPDRFGKMIGFGVVILITLQAIINMGVSTAILPNKGLPLPFISYGGSNLVCCMFGVGILINIYRQSPYLNEAHFPKLVRVKVTPRI